MWAYEISGLFLSAKVIVLDLIIDPKPVEFVIPSP
jgi:hypothetical protein